MTREEITFIGRETELGQIEGLLTDWDTRRILCVNGEGGVGKTRLLQEVYARWRGDFPRLLVTNVLMFDDRTLHVPDGLRHRLTEELGQDNFGPYLRQRMDYRKMTRAGLSKERLDQEMQAVLETFRECWRKTLSERRGVILLDTTDALEESGSTWSYIVSDLVPQPCNALFLIAGRNAQKLHGQLRRKLGEDVLLLELPPLGVEDSEEYLRARQDQLHYVIDPEIAQKIVFLAQGRPILIDLAVDWLANQHPLPWLEEESLEELESLSRRKMKARMREFEHNLVRGVLELRTDLDRLFLALAHVYPLNEPLIAQLLGLSKKGAAALLEETESFISIKQLASGWITLHDEVRRLLDEVEAEVDPEERRKRADNLKAVPYFEEAVQELRKSIQELEEKEKEAQKKGQAQEAFKAAVRCAELEGEYWEAAGQLLHHTLRVSPSKGMDIFAQIFDEATRAYRFAIRDHFIEQVDIVSAELTPQQRYELDIRRAKNLLDSGEYVEGKELLLEMLSYEGLRPSQQVDMYIQLGNQEVRLGNFGAGLASFEEAVRLSRESGLEDWLTRALNALGWGHRLIGNFNLAIQSYEEALELSVRLKDRRREAWILNNMAFAIARLGRHAAALNLCGQALELWEEEDFDRGRGAVHEVYGEVYVLSGNLEEAIEHYRIALDIFEPTNDTEWLSRVYAGLGLAYRLAGDLDRAEEVLDQALDIDLRKDRAMILHRLAHVYQERSQIDEAEEFFLKSYELSKTVSDADLELNNLGDLAGIALRKGDYDRLEEFVAKFEEYKRVWPDVNFPRAVGTLTKKLGDLALCANPDDVGQAWQYYEQAFPLLAEYGELRPYSAQVQFAELNDLLRDRGVPASTVRELGGRLRELWRKEGLDSSHPDALRFFLRWREGEYYD